MTLLNVGSISDTASLLRSYNMPYCPNCGNEVAEEHKYCYQCGKPLGVVEDTTKQDTAKQDTERKPLVKRFFNAIIAFAILESVAVIGGLPIVKVEILWGTVYRALWDNMAVFIGFLAGTTILMVFLLRIESTKMNAVITTISIGILVATAFGVRAVT